MSWVASIVNEWQNYITIKRELNTKGWVRKYNLKESAWWERFGHHIIKQYWLAKIRYL